MDDKNYQRLTDAAFRRISDAFEDVDPEVVDCDVAGDVVTLTMRGGKRCIVNTQRPVHQIWLAANARAWHFAWDEASGEWWDDRGRGEELFTTVARAIKDAIGIDVTV